MDIAIGYLCITCKGNFGVVPVGGHEARRRPPDCIGANEVHHTLMYSVPPANI